MDIVEILDSGDEGDASVRESLSEQLARQCTSSCADQKRRSTANHEDFFVEFGCLLPANSFFILTSAARERPGKIAGQVPKSASKKKNGKQVPKL